VRRTFLQLTFFIFFTIAHNAFPQVEFQRTVQPFTFPSARLDALGGVHAAIADDFYTTLFANPAGLADVEYQFYKAALSFDAIDIDLVVTMLNPDNQQISGLIPLLTKPFSADINIGTPLAIGRVGNNWGLGFFNVSRVNMAWDPAEIFLITPTVTEEVFVKGGYGFRLIDTDSHWLDIGITTHAHFRMGFIGPKLLITEVKYLLEKIGEFPFETQTGIGFDTGIRWTIGESFIIAAAVNDFFSPSHSTLYRDINGFFNLEKQDAKWIPVLPKGTIGFAWKMKSPFWHRYISDLTIAADFQGLLNNLNTPMRDPLLDISACLELRLLEVLTLRGSWSEMMPGGGFGLNFSFMQFDLSYHGKELGVSPGDVQTWALSIDFIFASKL
jgi:hypothetical protein